jgi:uncharacterized protein
MKRQLHKNIKVRRGAHGLGLFAAGLIKRGAVVAEYWGRVITEDEANRLGGKYLFELDAHMAIDGRTRNNVARYINHSCSPNCDPEEHERQRVFIVARRDIKPGEEFGYNYGREYWDEHIRPIGCRCGCGGKGPRRWRS